MAIQTSGSLSRASFNPDLRSAPLPAWKKRRRHTPNQISRKLAEANKLLADVASLGLNVAA